MSYTINEFASGRTPDGRQFTYMDGSVVEAEDDAHRELLEQFVSSGVATRAETRPVKAKTMHAAKGTTA